MKKLTLAVLGTGFLLGLVQSCHTKPPTPLATISTDPKDPVFMREEDLSTFASLVTEAKLGDFFHGTGPFTSFAPTNAAFEKFDQKKLQELKDPKNRDELIDLINYHVILGKYLSSTLKPGKTRTVNGKTIDIRVEDGKIQVNNANVIKSDLIGPNGVTYVIDTVLVP